MTALTPVLSVAPAADVISLTEAKAHLRVDHTDDDTLISSLIAAAVGHVDGYAGTLGRCLINQTWKEEFGCWPSGDVLRLALANAQSITSIKYYDADDVQQTLSSSAYSLHADALGPYVKLASGESWPTLKTRDDAIEVMTVYGFGAAATAVPGPIKAALLLIIGHLYENREDVVIGTIATKIPMGAKSLLAPYSRTFV